MVDEKKTSLLRTNCDAIKLSGASQGEYYYLEETAFEKQTEKRFKELGLIKGKKVFVVMKTSSFILLRLNGFYLPLRISEADFVSIKKQKALV